MFKFKIMKGKKIRQENPLGKFCSRYSGVRHIWQSS